MDLTTSTSDRHPQLRLWLDEHQGSWLRQQGRTRVLVIDDQWHSRSVLFDVREDGPLTPGEQLLSDWLNVELQFMPMPTDFSAAGSTPSGTFSDEWFERNLREMAEAPRPIAAVLLDLMFGHDDSEQSPRGARFLGILNRHLPDAPVLILSSIVKSPDVFGMLKTGKGLADRHALTFQDYLPKSDPNSNMGLAERIGDAVLKWGHLSDPHICAFSAPMRKLACSMRQIVLDPKTMPYEEVGAGEYPRPVVVIGEYGSGKNFLASHLVRMSGRSEDPFPTPVTFSDLDEDSVVTSLFGVGPYNDAPEHIYTDIRTGAVVMRTTRGRRPPRSSPHLLALASLGRLQIADMGAEPQSENGPHVPKRGTVLFDELGAAPESMQTRLLGLLNSGRFTPRFINVPIPTERRLDLWYIMTFTPQAFERLREDLRSRLTRAHVIRVPSLSVRKSDVVALAIRNVSDPAATDPKAVFTDEALAYMLEMSRDIEVRELLGILRGLSDVSDIRPFSVRELERARAVACDVHSTGASRLPVDHSLTVTVNREARLKTGSETSSHGLDRNVPLQLGDYKRIEEIGRGGMGIVERAKQLRLDRMVALKRLKPELGNDEFQVRKFFGEASIVANLRHPGIVQIIDCVKDGGHKFFSMEYVGGGTLEASAALHPLHAEEAADIVWRAAHAVEYCHENGVLHCDLKPANILLDSERRPKLTDFGQARRIGEEVDPSQGHRVMGTPSYMAPEQAAGEDALGPAVDVYGLGAILYRLLTWRAPFGAPTVNATLDQVRVLPPVPPRRFDESIPRDLEGICLTCLEKNPAKRYHSVDALATDLQNFLNGRRVEATYRSRVTFSVSDVIESLSGIAIAPFENNCPMGSLNDVTASVAAISLGYVEQAIASLEKSGDTCTILKLYRYLTGEKAQDKNSVHRARSQLGTLLLLNEVQTVRALQQSKRLLWFATDIGKRNAEVRKLVERAQVGGQSGGIGK